MQSPKLSARRVKTDLQTSGNIFIQSSSRSRSSSPNSNQIVPQNLVPTNNNEYNKSTTIKCSNIRLIQLIIVLKVSLINCSNKMSDFDSRKEKVLKLTLWG